MNTNARAALLLFMLLVAAGVTHVHASEPQTASASSGHIIIMAQLTVKPGREQDFIKLLAQMKQRVKAQDSGNIRYELYAVAPAASQAAGTPSTFVFVEEWRDQAAFAGHGKWAGAIVRNTWPTLTDSMHVMRLSRLDLQ